jgi:hypothetical protein
VPADVHRVGDCLALAHQLLNVEGVETHLMGGRVDPDCTTSFSAVLDDCRERTFGYMTPRTTTACS